MTYKNITVPTTGESISIKNNALNVPHKPIITYIEAVSYTHLTLPTNREV